jgi:hypothetical protein
MTGFRRSPAVNPTIDERGELPRPGHLNEFNPDGSARWKPAIATCRPMARIAPELEFIGSNPVPQITPERMGDGARGREINIGRVTLTASSAGNTVSPRSSPWQSAMGKHDRRRASRLRNLPGVVNFRQWLEKHAYPPR